ncbi:flavin-containing monooxygenase FMO GS-OX-like 4 [Asterias rubens]|uniref:flavin-containing monooxygenase FMO GS-OX-like 4 n=1 Tax=Asterias rubens TaxID=7604 RepID=UPI001454ED18|nr:flavin-containing monooxygenase FMO GS-OX-like 4 [Asterias rubens]
MIRVAVIGGGPAGLCAARYLGAKPDVFKFVVYEQTDDIGGAWVYTDEVGTNKYGQPVQSSMYSNLRTNLPKQVMMFPDLPIDEGGKTSFITHFEVLQYLKRYATTSNVYDKLKLLTRVESVKPVTSDNKTSWEVIVKSLDNPDAAPQVNQFDAVMVCNGHYAVPRFPDIPGVDSFTGKLLHSHDYRHPEDFNGKTLLMLGAGNSGRDIAMNLCPNVKKIYLSHLHPAIECPLPDNLIQVPDIKHVEEETVVFTDGRSVKADVIMLCTGYEYTFPFLKPECEVEVDRNRVTPLYRHIIHTQFPSLSFIGIPWKVCPFPQISCQVRFAMAALDGTMKLPSQTEMNADIQKDYDQRRNKWKMPHRYAHMMGGLQWDYNKELLQLAGVDDDIPPAIIKLYEKVSQVRSADLMNYKKHNFELTNNMEDWRSIESAM